MKVLISIVIGLLVVGCGKKQSTNTNDGNSAPKKSAKKKVGKETPSKGDDNNGTTAKPVKELTEEDIVGEYEDITPPYTSKYVFLENGIAKAYRNDTKSTIEAKWKIVDGELRIEPRQKWLLQKVFLE